MCFQVYLGSSTECPEIPYIDRPIEPNPSGAPLWTDLFVHKHPENSGFSGTVPGLTTPYQYRLGIMPCGCGFQYTYPYGDDEDIDPAHRQLGDYLASCIERSQPLELYSFWDSDYDKPVEHHQRIIYDELYNPKFYFKERQLTLVYKDEQSIVALGDNSPVT